VRIFRLIRIARVAYAYGLDQLILDHELELGFWARLLIAVQRLMFWRDLSAPRAVRLRLALEDLGPIFVKFGQMLSTRRDLLPLDIADELARLQDRVPPFPVRTGRCRAGKGLRQAGGPKFSPSSTARRWPRPRSPRCISPCCRDGTEVAVKILRPGIEPVIEHDIALLKVAASLLERSGPKAGA
jgi:ubiquinone biosynthesis protein